MRHWALAIAALLGGVVGLLHADYVVIKINLATTKDKEDTEENQPGAVPGSPVCFQADGACRVDRACR